jgi:hypothetical protein
MYRRRIALWVGGVLQVSMSAYRDDIAPLLKVLDGILQLSEAVGAM